MTGLNKKPSNEDVKALSEAYLDASYAWESERIKNIPSIENFDFLSRLYGVHVEDLYVLKTTDVCGMEVHESVLPYGIDFDFIMKGMNGKEKEEIRKPA